MKPAPIGRRSRWRRLPANRTTGLARRAKIGKSGRDRASRSAPLNRRILARDPAAPTAAAAWPPRPMDERMRRPHEKIGAMSRAPFSRPPNARVVFDWLGQQPIAQRLAVQASRLAELRATWTRARRSGAHRMRAGQRRAGADDAACRPRRPSSGSSNARWARSSRCGAGASNASGSGRSHRLLVAASTAEGAVPAAALAAFGRLGQDSGSEALRAALARLVGNQRRRHDQG